MWTKVNTFKKHKFNLSTMIRSNKIAHYIKIFISQLTNSFKYVEKNRFVDKNSYYAKKKLN